MDFRVDKLNGYERFAECGFSERIIGVLIKAGIATPVMFKPVLFTRSRDVVASRVPPEWKSRECPATGPGSIPCSKPLEAANYQNVTQHITRCESLQG